MNLDIALKSLKNHRFEEYFRWKHDLKYDQTKEKKTEEDFLKSVQRKTLNPFVEWERTTEYKQLLVLLLESKLADDLEEIYSIVTKNAKKGDDKAVRLFLSLQKEIMENAKLAKQTFSINEEKPKKKDKEEKTDEFDDLILD